MTPSYVQLFVTPWTVAYQAPPSMGFSRQEYWSWSELPFPSPGDLPDPGIEPGSPVLSEPPWSNQAVVSTKSGLYGDQTHDLGVISTTL